MITFEIDELTPCLKDSVTGEILETEVIELKRKTSSLERDELQEIVDKYVEENHLYDCFIPPRINVRKYLQYVEENNITDPSAIPSEILDSFMRTEKPKSAVV